MLSRFNLHLWPLLPSCLSDRSSSNLTYLEQFWKPRLYWPLCACLARWHKITKITFMCLWLHPNVILTPLAVSGLWGRILRKSASAECRSNPQCIQSTGAPKWKTFCRLSQLQQQTSPDVSDIITNNHYDMDACKFLQLQTKRTWLNIVEQNTSQPHHDTETCRTTGYHNAFYKCSLSQSAAYISLVVSRSQKLDMVTVNMSRFCTTEVQKHIWIQTSGGLEDWRSPLTSWCKACSLLWID